MLTLGDRQRRPLLRISVFLCGSALLLAPLVAQSSIELAQQRAELGRSLSFVPLPSGPSLQTGLTPAKDPFVPDSTPALPAANPPAAIGWPSVLELPPNRGAAQTPLPPNFGDAGSALTVHAVVTGGGSRALIESAGVTRIVQAGDSVDGRVVQTIDAGGVHFTDGSTAPVTVSL
ncbi:MAG: hypothetical protein M3R35_00180 [Candidatus Eremiobacteraeota bacterium]|nr:hypothetical protein [Candidatus Eremiobacteraeota bacterium]